MTAASPRPRRPAARGVATAASILLAGLLAACSDGDAPSPGPSSASTSASTSPSPSASADPSGGTSAAPAPVTATEAIASWRPVDTGGDPRATVTQVDAGSWVSVARGGATATLTTPAGEESLAAPAGFTWNDVVSDGRRVVLVAQDDLEEQPSRATLVDLATGRRDVLDGSSQPPTVSGGSWVLGGGRLYHPTFAPSGRYCLAEVELASRGPARGRTTYCAPPRSGFSEVLVSRMATTLLTFPARSTCRTPSRLEGTRAVPLEGVERCRGWDSAVTGTGAIWSVVVDLNRSEQARFVARDERSWSDLGPGLTGSLTWCGDSAYFVRDPQTDREPARLMRWTPRGELQTVYESAGGGSAFLADPRCAGDVLTLSAFSQAGDRQVWARVP